MEEGSRNVRLGTLIALMVDEGQDWKQVEIPPPAAAAPPATHAAAAPVVPPAAPPPPPPPTQATSGLWVLSGFSLTVQIIPLYCKDCLLILIHSNLLMEWMEVYVHTHLNVAVMEGNFRFYSHISVLLYYPQCESGHCHGVKT